MTDISYKRFENWGLGVFSGSVNMAIEEYLIRRVADEAGGETATIRSYSFPKNSVIIGYAQAPDAVFDSRMEVTRRITGGAHVQTGPNTLGYSVVVPRNGTFKKYDEMRDYFAKRVANALTNLGIGSVEVDNSTSTINVDGRIIEGHAMWWGAKSALIHGLVVLSPYDVDRMASGIFLKEREIGGEKYSEYEALRRLPTVCTELGYPDKIHMLRKVVSDAILREVTGGEYSNMEINGDTIDASIDIFKRRHGKHAWIKERKPAFTEDEVEAIPGEELNGPLRKGLGYCFFLEVDDKSFKEMASKDTQ